MEKRRKSFEQNSNKTGKRYWRLRPKSMENYFSNPPPVLSICTPRYLATCVPDVFFSFGFTSTNLSIYPSIVLLSHTVLFYFAS